MVDKINSDKKSVSLLSFREFLFNTRNSKSLFALGSSVLGFGLGYLANDVLSFSDFYSHQQEVYGYFVDLRLGFASLFPLLSVPIYDKLLFKDKSLKELLSIYDPDSSFLSNSLLKKVQDSSFPSLDALDAIKALPSNVVLENSSISSYVEDSDVSDKLFFSSIRSSSDSLSLVTILDNYLSSISKSDRSVSDLSRLSFAYLYAKNEFSSDVKESVWNHLSSYICSELSSRDSFLLRGTLSSGGTFEEARRFADVFSVYVDDSVVDSAILLKKTSSDNSSRFSLESKINNLFYSSSASNLLGPLTQDFTIGDSSFLLMERADGLSLYEALLRIGDVDSLESQELFFKSVYSKKKYFLDLVKGIHFDRRDFDHYYLSLSDSAVSDKHISSILSSYSMMPRSFFKPVLDYHSLNLFIDFNNSNDDGYVLTKIDNGSIYVGSELTDLAAYVLINPILPVDSAYSFVVDELSSVPSLHSLHSSDRMDLFLQELFLRSYSLLSKDSINFDLKNVLQEYSLNFVDIALKTEVSDSVFSMDFKDMFSLIKKFNY